jgi:hypothetical protein
LPGHVQHVLPFIQHQEGLGQGDGPMGDIGQEWPSEAG